MAVLYYIDFSGKKTEDLLSTYADKSDPERLSKLTRTFAPEAKVRSLLAGYLLQVAVRSYLKETGKESKLLQAAGRNAEWNDEERNEERKPLYRYGENGKPYLLNYPDLFFNLSHSKDVVVCVLSGQEIGVDVQKHVKVKENLAHRFFTAEEDAFLDTLKQEDGSIGKDYAEWFFRLWSIKESYIKYTGKGMKQGLDTFEILYGEGKITDKETGDVAYFQEIVPAHMKEYSCSVCMKTKEEIKVVRVEIPETGKEKDEEKTDL
jgi:phosphopantetheine--protein transferase-like protein